MQQSSVPHTAAGSFNYNPNSTSECLDSRYTDPPSPPVYSYRIINCFPHDPDAFTQGLIYYAGLFLRRNRFRRAIPPCVRLIDKTDPVLQQINLPPEYFW